MPRKIFRKPTLTNHEQFSLSTFAEFFKESLYPFSLFYFECKEHECQRMNNFYLVHRKICLNTGEKDLGIKLQRIATRLS